MKRILSSLLSILLLLAVSALPAAQGSAPAAQAVPAEKLEAGFDYFERFVPAYAPLYGGALDSYVDISLTNRGPESITVFVQSWIEKVSEPAGERVTLRPGETLVVKQSPTPSPGAFDGADRLRPGTFHVRVTQADQAESSLLYEGSAEITVYGRRDFVWQDGLDELNNHKLLAAWVTPGAPAVQALLLRAGDYMDTWPLPQGYDGTDLDESGQVWQRLEAVWGSISEFEVSTEFLEGSLKDHGVLPVRTPYDVLAGRKGNWLEKGLLFASAAEAVGLETALIFTPEERVVTAVRMDQSNALYYFVDTSLLGLSGFGQAAARGESAWEELKAHLQAEDTGYQWVDLITVRNEGVLPMPDSQEKAGSEETLADAPANGIGIHYIIEQHLVLTILELGGADKEIARPPGVQLLHRPGVQPWVLPYRHLPPGRYWMTPPHGSFSAPNEGMAGWTVPHARRSKIKHGHSSLMFSIPLFNDGREE